MKRGSNVRGAVAALALLGGTLLAAAPAAGQGGFPNRPITMLVGFAPGGGTDITARIIAKKLSENLGQQVVVENRTGAGGNIATDMIAKAAPDGYVIGLSSIGSLTVAPHIVANLPYDPRRDLAPITMAVTFSNVLVVHPSFGVTSLAEYLQRAREKPGGVAYGSSGIGGTAHLAGELLAMMAKVDLVHVPYKGGAPAMADLLGGQIPSMFASAASALPHMRSGKIRAIAVTGAHRSQFMPDIPTIAESGFPGYEATNWYAYVAPAKTPREIIVRLNREIVRVLQDPEIRAELGKHGMEATPSTPEELGKHIDRELEVWGRIVKIAGIKAE